jgi:hypothetical protein
MCNMPSWRREKETVRPQTLLLEDKVETVTAEDTEEGREGRIMPLKVGNAICHILVANEGLVDERSPG